MLNYVRQVFKIRQFSTRFIFETKWVTPKFFCILTQVTHYLTAVNLKKSIDWKMLTRASLRQTSYLLDFLFFCLSSLVVLLPIPLCCHAEVRIRPTPLPPILVYDASVNNHCLMVSS